MACKTCGQAGSNCGCDTSCFGGTANWLVPVKVAPPIEMASRKFAYITPDQTVWVANFDGTEMIPLGGEDIDWIVDADEALPPLEEANPLRIYRQDDKMFIVNEAKTDWIDLTESSSFEQVQADWDVTDEASKAFIKNKPTIPTPIDPVQSDWNQTDSNELDFIKNKPTIPVPVPQVQSNWNETDTNSPAFIQNKPTITPVEIHHGASFVAKTATSTPVTVSANTLVSLNVTDAFTSVPVNVYPSSQTVLDVLGSNTVGQPFVIKEGSQAGQAVDFDIVFGITPNFAGNTTATLIWEIYSLGSNTVVRTGALTQTSSMPTGYTRVPCTIKATLVADEASLTNGYAIRLISDRGFTYDVSRIVRSINAMDVQE